MVQKKYPAATFAEIIIPYQQYPSVCSGLMTMLLLPYKNWCLHRFKQTKCLPFLK